MDRASDVVVVMGVSGVGKTSVARGLCAVLDAAYLEADDYHPPENVAAMAAGRPLTDAMRAPWLAAVARAAAEARQIAPVVLACSALKASYRDTLRRGAGPLRFVYLHADRDVIAERIALRQDHFMPVSLLDSQFATLEPPTDEPDVVTVDVTGDLSDVIARAAKALNRA